MRSSVDSCSRRASMPLRTSSSSACQSARRSSPVQHDRDQPRAVIGREGIVLPVEIGEVALRDGVHPLVLRHGHQDAGAFAVDAEILRAACGDQHFGAARGDRARGGGIGLEPRRRSPDRRCRSSAARQCRSSAQSTACHSGPVRLAPVGLWQQPCNSTTSPARSPARSAIMPSKSTPAGFAVEIAVADGFDPQMLEDAEVVGAMSGPTRKPAPAGWPCE